MSGTGATLLDSLPATLRITDPRRGEGMDRAALLARVDSLSGELASAGAARGRTLVVGEASGVDALVALLAAWRLGAVAVMVNPGLAADEQRNVLEHTGASCWRGGLRPGVAVPAGAGAGKPLLSPGGDAAVVLMTSGTTGRPKGIVLSHRALAARTALNIEAMGRADLERSFCVLPVHFGHGLIGNCLTPLMAGGELVLMDGPSLAETAALGATIDRHRVTFMSSVPSFWRLACRASPRPAAGTLRRLHVGSAPLSHRQWSEIADWAGTRKVFNMLGMTETANWIAGGSLEESRGRDGYVGRPWGGSIAVLGDDGTIAARGRGEVLVKSPSVMDGYLGDAEKTAATFLDGWLRTGDIGELDEEGGLTLVGRTKWEINRSGIKIQAEEIDLLLERHPDVVEACAFGVPDAVSGEAVGAAVVLCEGSAATMPEIREWCRAHVRLEAVPARLYAMASLPRNERGKVDRRAVRLAALGPETPA